MSWTEMDLKDYVARDPSALLDEPLLVINREIAVGNGGFADFVAVDSDSNIVIIEAKVGRVKEEVFTQAIGYASVVDGWSSDDLTRMYRAYYLLTEKATDTFEEAFRATFGKSYDMHSGASRIVLLGKAFAPGCISMADFYSRRGIAVELVSYEAHFQSNGKIAFRRASSGSAVIEHAVSRNLTQPLGEKRRTAIFEDVNSRPN